MNRWRGTCKGYTRLNESGTVTESSDNRTDASNLYLNCEQEDYVLILSKAYIAAYWSLSWLSMCDDRPEGWSAQHVAQNRQHYMRPRYLQEYLQAEEVHLAGMIIYIYGILPGSANTALEVTRRNILFRDKSQNHNASGRQLKLDVMRTRPSLTMWVSWNQERLTILLKQAP